MVHVYWAEYFTKTCNVEWQSGCNLRCLCKLDWMPLDWCVISYIVAVILLLLMTRAWQCLALSSKLYCVCSLISFLFVQSWTYISLFIVWFWHFVLKFLCCHNLGLWPVNLKTANISHHLKTFSNFCCWVSDTAVSWWPHNLDSLFFKVSVIVALLMGNISTIRRS